VQRESIIEKNNSKLKSTFIYTTPKLTFNGSLTLYLYFTLLDYNIIYFDDAQVNKGLTFLGESSGDVIVDASNKPNPAETHGRHVQDLIEGTSLKVDWSSVVDLQAKINWFIRGSLVTWG